MQPYTVAMLKMINMPRSVNVRGKGVKPEVLFSPSLCEPMLFWYAQSLAVQLHDKTIMDIEVRRDDSRLPAVNLVRAERKLDFSENGIEGLSLAASLMLISEAGRRIITPALLSNSFDYESVIFEFREKVKKCYGDGDILSPNDYVLNDFIYDKIIKPTNELSNNYDRRLAINWD